MQRLGPAAICSIQESSFGARIYYNALVPWKNGRMIKYGVISVQDLLDDLREWTNLYVSGRLQKPVKVIYSDPTIDAAVARNVENAARVALLSLPESFTDKRFFCEVATLSYIGDIRIALGAEDPNKIQTMVAQNWDAFCNLYKPVLSSLTGCKPMSGTDGGERWMQQPGPDSRRAMLAQLPASLTALLSVQSSRLRVRDGVVQEDALPLRDYAQCRHALHKALKTITLRASLTQTMKGLLTAGLRRSALYALSKYARSGYRIW